MKSMLCLQKYPEKTVAAVVEGLFVIKLEETMYSVIAFV